jgi:hypothetical protein
MNYDENNASYTIETRVQLINEHIHSLNKYCQRGLRNVDVACEIWDRLITEKDTQKRLSILGDGESFLQASIAVAREYSGQIPSPNRLKAFVEDDDIADLMIGLLNEMSMVIFQFTGQMENMVEQCAILRRHLEQEAMDATAAGRAQRHSIIGFLQAGVRQSSNLAAKLRRAILPRGAANVPCPPRVQLELLATCKKCIPRG